MKKIINLFSFLLMLLGSYPAISWATPYNIAPQARVSASSSIDAGHDAAFFLGGADAFQLLRHKACLPRYTRRSGGLAGGRFGRLGYDILGHGIPRAAGGALPRPFCGLISTFRTIKQRFCFHFLSSPAIHRKYPAAMTVASVF